MNVSTFMKFHSARISVSILPLSFFLLLLFSHQVQWISSRKYHCKFICFFLFIHQHSSQSSDISSQEDETVCYMVCLSHSQPLTCCSSTWNCSTISFCFSEKVYYHSCYLQSCEWYLYNTFHSFPHAICLWLCSFLSCKDHHFFIFHPSIFGYIFSLN